MSPNLEVFFGKGGGVSFPIQKISLQIFLVLKLICVHLICVQLICVQLICVHQESKANRRVAEKSGWMCSGGSVSFANDGCVANMDLIGSGRIGFCIACNIKYTTHALSKR